MIGTEKEITEIGGIETTIEGEEEGGGAVEIEGGVDHHSHQDAGHLMAVEQRPRPCTSKEAEDVLIKGGGPSQDSHVSFQHKKLTHKNCLTYMYSVMCVIA